MKIDIKLFRWHLFIVEVDTLSKNIVIWLHLHSSGIRRQYHITSKKKNNLRKTLRIRDIKIHIVFDIQTQTKAVEISTINRYS